MFPRYNITEPVTIYTPVRNAETNEKRFVRTAVRGCIWQQDSKVAYKTQGVADASLAILSIPYLHDYVPEKDFTGIGWTIKQGAELQASYVVRGEIAFEFILPAEDPEFYKVCVVPFEKTYAFKHAKEIVNHNAGSRGQWYIKLIC